KTEREESAGGFSFPRISARVKYKDPTTIAVAIEWWVHRGFDRTGVPLATRESSRLRPGSRVEHGEQRPARLVPPGRHRRQEPAEQSGPRPTRCGGTDGKAGRRGGRCGPPEAVRGRSPPGHSPESSRSRLAPRPSAAGSGSGTAPAASPAQAG